MGNSNYVVDFVYNPFYLKIVFKNEPTDYKL